MVIPNNLKYYPDSGRFYKYRPKKEKLPSRNRGENVIQKVPSNL
jgi:hypothetical protein